MGVHVVLEGRLSSAETKGALAGIIVNAMTRQRQEAGCERGDGSQSAHSSCRSPSRALRSGDLPPRSGFHCRDAAPLRPSIAARVSC